jgi:hypothetical protein
MLFCILPPIFFLLYFFLKNQDIERGKMVGEMSMRMHRSKSLSIYILKKKTLTTLNETEVKKMKLLV